MWNVQVQVSREKDGWTNSFGLPSFQLDGIYLGIVNERHAIEFVQKILDPFENLEERNIELHISVAKL